VVSTPLKNMSQIGNVPQIGSEHKKSLKPPPRLANLFTNFLGHPRSIFKPNMAHIGLPKKGDESEHHTRPQTLLGCGPLVNHACEFM